MDKGTDFAINKYVKLIRRKFSNIEAAYIFGSYAKELSNIDSDIDLAIIFSDLDDSSRFDVQVQLMILASQIDSRIEPHPISHNDFYSDNPFVLEIKNTGIEINTITI